MISEARLGPYRQGTSGEGTSGDDFTTCAAYAWNIGLCESLYPSLNGLEIALRNSIQSAATNEFGDEFWFDHLSLQKSRDALSNARKKVSGDQNGQTISANDLVAQLNFGFWVGLFDSQYEQYLWPKLLRAVFPSIPRRNRTRATLSKRLHQVRGLRNRVFHHEPLWNRDNLDIQHQQILETIGWINPNLRRFVETIDRFPDVFREGPQAYEQKLALVFQH